MADVWRPIPGHPQYQVSNTGRVVSLHNGRQHELQPWDDQHGYPAVALHTDRRAHRVKVHRLVAEAFIGPCPPGMEVRHLDGSRDNNRVENLSYGTRSDNIRDAVRHGTHWQVQKTHCPRGHPHTPENNLRAPAGRKCRACHNARARAKRAAAVDRGEA